MSDALWKMGFPELASSPKTLQELLTSGELPEEKYLAWASETYKLPRLANDFFNLAKNFNILLENPQQSWNDSFFPVQEWNGVVYVACLEPQAVTLTKKHCLVLGSYSAMKILWSKMEQPLEASVVIDAESLNENLDKARENSFANLKLEVGKVPAAAPSPAAPAPATAEASNFSTDFDSKTLSGLSLDDLKLGEIEPTKSATARRPPLPKPTNPTTKSASAPATAAVPAKPVTPITPSTTVKEKPLDDSLSKPGFSMNPGFTATNFKLPKELTQAAKKVSDEIREITNVAALPKNDLDGFTSTKTIMPFPERTSQFTFTRMVYASQVILEAESKIQDNTDPQKALLSAFKLLQDYYKKLMWVVRDQKGYAFPIACNSEWQFSEEAWNEPMAFKYPNPFRTSKLTQKPYHGPVFASPATDKYFKLWNNGQRPDFFTVVPISMFGKVFGYLVGCEKGPHFHQQHSLEMMQVAGKELLETFIKIHNSMNKAA